MFERPMFALPEGRGHDVDRGIFSDRGLDQGHLADGPVLVQGKRGKPTPADAIEALLAVAPCPVIHSVWELPEDHPGYGRASRSCYWPVSKRNGDRDYIMLNEGTARAWNYALTLAHEVGHALDHHKLHPAQHLLKGKHTRYRVELASTSFCIRVAQQCGRHNTAFGRRNTDGERKYLGKYTQGTNPDLDTVLKAIPSQVLALNVHRP